MLLFLFYYEKPKQLVFDTTVVAKKEMICLGKLGMRVTVLLSRLDVLSLLQTNANLEMAQRRHDLLPKNIIHS